MKYSELKSILDEYNWDDGFEIPKSIINDVGCDLAMALEVFYLADGYAYLCNTSKEKACLNEWEIFMANLYKDIYSEKFTKTKETFLIPLTKIQKYKLEKAGVPHVFLEDL